VGFFELLIFTYEDIDRDPDGFFSFRLGFRSVLARTLLQIKPSCGLGSAFFIALGQVPMKGAVTMRSIHWYFFI